ncbi:MAG: DUF86 domain-containing protein [Desulfobacteraceae bacterium]|nr:MAG: DUF86 domain-containing protein [Desulfobacteraceae bacterium]
MKDEILKYLHDIHEAVIAVKCFVKGKQLIDYQDDEMLRSAIERKFEIIGEALSRIQKTAPDVLLRIRNYRDIISFRNILIHGYDSIDDRIVRGVVEEDLDPLAEDIETLLAER